VIEKWPHWSPTYQITWRSFKYITQLHRLCLCDASGDMHLPGMSKAFYTSLCGLWLT
jgi:hypothetical protein